nr:MAG TPA: hypothetical protein [Caudoviricetes sp.]
MISLTSKFKFLTRILHARILNRSHLPLDPTAHH